MQQLRRNWETDCTVSFVDDQGDQAQVEGDPVWTSSDPATIEVKATADPFVVTVQALGAVGAMATLTVEADADLGEGVVEVIASEQIQVVSGQAASASFSFGTPRPIETP